MEIRQGFSMTFLPVDGESELYELKLYTHLAINDRVSTRDQLRGAFLALDSEWVGKIPPDQFAVLASEISSGIITAGYPADAVGTFREDVAKAMEEIAKQLLGG